MVAEGNHCTFITAAKHIYSPPLLEDVENTNIWLREIDLLQCVTELIIKQLGPVIYLSLPSKICQACIDISVQSLSSDNGLSILLEKIRGLYAKDKHSLAYMAYDTFKTLHRPSDMNIIDYKHEFEQLHRLRHIRRAIARARLCTRLKH